MTDPYRHSRVGGPFIGTRTIRRLRLSAESRESRRDSSETRQSTGRGAAGLVMLALRQYPQGEGAAGLVMLALRQYPQGEGHVGRRF